MRNVEWIVLIVMSACTSALHYGLGDERTTALQAVRRAVRLTRTEGIRSFEYLASLALMRVRRLQSPFVYSDFIFIDSLVSGLCRLASVGVLDVRPAPTERRLR